VETLAQHLQAAGYVTAGFSTNYLASDVQGLARGMDVFRLYRERGLGRPTVYLRSADLLRRVARWLDRRPPGPLFLYIHATDPHFPYLPRQRFARGLVGAPANSWQESLDAVRPYHNGNEQWGHRPIALPSPQRRLLSDLYDASIREADDGFGRFLVLLESHGLLDHAVIVLTSDHGEELLEHQGLGHGQTLATEVLHVPLIIAAPGLPRGHVDDLAQHIDIAPTILDLLGFPIPSVMDGSSLRRARPFPARTALSSTRLAGFTLDSVTQSRWKIVRDLQRSLGARFTVWNRQRDPWERSSIRPPPEVLIGYARDQLRAHRVLRGPGPPAAEIPLERLRALGYVVD
jgi:arylsulfatase A-like enzyme